MATTPRGGLLDRWLTINNQGNDSSTGEGGGGGGTDWARFLHPDFAGAQRFGYMGALPAESGADDSGGQQGNPMQELQDWMRSSGYSQGINPTFNGGQANNWMDPQGNEVDGTRREFAAPDEGPFNIATAMLAAAGGGLMGAGLPGWAQGAMAGGAAGGTRDASLGSIAKGAAIGGITGGLNEHFGISDKIRSMFPGGDVPGGVGVEAGAGSAPVGFDPMPQFNISPGDFGAPLDGLFNPYGTPDFSMGQFMPSAGASAGQPGQPNMPPADSVGDSVTVKSGVPFDPMPQFNAPPGEFGQPFELTNPMGGFPGTDGGGFDPSMARFLPPAMSQVSGASSQPSPQQPQNPAQQPDPSFRPSQNYGDGMTGNQTGAFDKVLDITGSTGLAAGAASLIGGAGNVLDGLGGLKTLLPIAGAIAGSKPSGGGTASTQNNMDPEAKKLLYGQFFPEWSKRFAASNGGVNPTMEAGWNAQLGLLSNPQIGQELSSMRGQGLLQSQGQIAGNPFRSGQMQLQGGAQGLLGNMQMPRDPSRRFSG